MTTLRAVFEDWGPEPPRVRIYFGSTPVGDLTPVREFHTDYDSGFDKAQREEIAEETMALALSIIFTQRPAGRLSDLFGAV
jgi:hypothetical protein